MIDAINCMENYKSILFICILSLNARNEQMLEIVHWGKKWNGFFGIKLQKLQAYMILTSCNATAK